MTNENTLRAIYEFFDPTLPRLGPGNDETTDRALGILEGTLPEPDRTGGLRILDLGCGNGAQALRLAERLDGDILAIDNHRPFMDELDRRVEARELVGRIETRTGDMGALDPEIGLFDLIWAEGSIYNVGVHEGLSHWRDFLKPGGCVGFSELAWFTEDVPEECRGFFAEAYPPMTGVEETLRRVPTGSYDIVGHFLVPEAAWWAYLEPLERRFTELADRVAEDEVLAMVVDGMRREEDIYRRFKSHYGYLFVLLKDRRGRRDP